MNFKPCQPIKYSPQIKNTRIKFKKRNYLCLLPHCPAGSSDPTTFSPSEGSSLDSAPQHVLSAPWQLSLTGSNDQIVVLSCIMDPDICYPSLWEDYMRCHPTAIRPGHVICLDRWMWQVSLTVCSFKRQIMTLSSTTRQELRRHPGSQWPCGSNPYLGSSTPKDHTVRGRKKPLSS